MKKIKYIMGKLGEHRKELGLIGVSRWLAIAIKSCTMSFITKGKVHIKGEGNIKSRKKGYQCFLF